MTEDEEEVEETDLQVTKADSPDPVIAGTDLTYTITITNNGPADAQNVELNDAVPTGTTFVSVAAPTGWTVSAPAVGGTGTVTATVPTLAGGASAVFTIVVHVDSAAPGTITNTAQVSSDTADTDAGNNSATQETTVLAPIDLDEPPTITAPVGATADATPTIVWSSVTGADGYQVIAYDRHRGVEVINEMVAAPATSFTPADPLGDGTFQVFVRAFRETMGGPREFGPFSLPEHFSISTLTPLLSPPELTGPADATSDPTPTIAWTAVAGAETYKVEIYDQTAGKLLPAAGAGGIAGEVFEVPVDLTVGRTYEAYVRVDGPATGFWGGPRVFTVTVATAAAVAAPKLTGPVPTINDSTPAFSWMEFAGAVDYRLELYDHDRGRRILVEENVSGTDFTLADPMNVVDPLSQVPGNYQVFVRANLADGSVSHFSNPINFRIAHHAPLPAAPVVSTPVTPTFDPTPTFIWAHGTALFHAARFDVVIETTAGVPVQTADNLSESFFTPATPLDPNGYRFRVRGENSFGEPGPWSTPYEFNLLPPPELEPLDAAFAEMTDSGLDDDLMADL